MADSLDKATREAAALIIATKRDELLAERNILMEKRAEILARIRRNDREFADCRSAARFFGLDIEFPAEDGDDAERLYRMRREAEREMREMALRHVSAHGAVIPRPSQTGRVIQGTAGNAPSTAPQPITVQKPSNRELVLQQLQRAGAAGSKAAPIREFIERTYNHILHEKTVGMTLYRLSKEGLVRREGQTWFFVPQTVETKNPGVSPPGLKE